MPNTVAVFPNPLIVLNRCHSVYLHLSTLIHKKEVTTVAMGRENVFAYVRREICLYMF